MNEPTIGVTYWTAERKKDMVNFRDWWLRNHAKYPNSYPIHLTQGEWEEQFLAWIGRE